MNGGGYVEPKENIIIMRESGRIGPDRAGPGRAGSSPWRGLSHVAPLTGDPRPRPDGRPGDSDCEVQ